MYDAVVVFKKRNIIKLSILEGRSLYAVRTLRAPNDERISNSLEIVNFSNSSDF